MTYSIKWLFGLVLVAALVASNGELRYRIGYLKQQVRDLEIRSRWEIASRHDLHLDYNRRTLELERTVELLEASDQVFAQIIAGPTRDHERRSSKLEQP